MSVGDYLKAGKSTLKNNIILFLDAQSMTNENYDVLDELELQGKIDKLTSRAVNTFIFYTAGSDTRVALSHLKMSTYKKRMNSNAIYIEL